jgi:hypothetical protein
MKSPARTVIMSHLSDAQEMLNMMDDHKFAEAISREINFAKYVLCMHGNNSLMKEIDPDVDYKNFCEKFPQK